MRAEQAAQPSGSDSLRIIGRRRNFGKDATILNPSSRVLPVSGDSHAHMLLKTYLGPSLGVIADEIERRSCRWHICCRNSVPETV